MLPVTILTDSSDRTYRKLFLAQVVALLCTGLATVALGFLAYDLTGEQAGLVLGTIFTIKKVAFVGVAPIAAAFVDHLPRRILLVSLDIVRTVVALALPFVAEIWQIYVLNFVLQSASAAFTPAFQSTITDVLPDEGLYTRALSLSRLVYDLENIIYERTTQGIRICFKAPPLRGLLALNLAAAEACAMVIVTTVVLIRVHLGLGESEVAITLGFFLPEGHPHVKDGRTHAHPFVIDGEHTRWTSHLY